MRDYADEDLRAAIAGVRQALEPLRAVAAAIDWQEPIRDRILEQVRVIEDACAELDRIEEDASQELL